MLRTVAENIARLNEADFGSHKEVLGLLLAEQLLNVAFISDSTHDVDRTVFRLVQQFRMIANDWDRTDGQRRVAVEVANRLIVELERQPDFLVAEIEQNCAVTQSGSTWGISTNACFNNGSGCEAIAYVSSGLDSDAAAVIGQAGQ